MSKIINGVEYLKISELLVDVDQSVHPRTVKRWLANGELRNVVTIYQKENGYMFYRLGLPNEDDELIEGSTFRYKLPGDDAWKYQNKVRLVIRPLLETLPIV